VLTRGALPNTYEAPTCQEAKEVRRKVKGLPPHVLMLGPSRLGVTDLISSARVLQERVLHQTPIEGLRVTGRWKLRRCDAGAGLGGALETIAFPHADPIKGTG
jgi:hypothetical protein